MKIHIHEAFQDRAMRADMAKVIVERPRHGSRTRGTPKGARRAFQRCADDGPPVREGIKRRARGGTKWLNEHLGPLRRYLDSQVGRPWNKVFAEICAHINRDSAVQDHVRDHVADYVVTHVILINGIPCNGAGDRSHGRPLHEMRWRPWYVCPRTGILRRTPSPKRPTPPRSGSDNGPHYVVVDELLQCRIIAGAWHLVGLERLPPVRAQCHDRDVVLDRPVSELDPDLARKHYGADVYAVTKRRLARRELSQFPIPVALWPT